MAKLFELPRYIAVEGPIRVGKSTLAQIIAERLHAQRMLALYRSGRQAEALAAYRQARRVLVDEIGVETVRRRHMELSQRLLEGALEQGWTARSPHDARERTSIVTLEHSDPRSAVAARRKKKNAAN